MVVNGKKKEKRRRGLRPAKYVGVEVKRVR